MAFRPEGISIGNGTTFYVGSIPTGAVYRGDLRTGTGAVLVPGATGRAAIGVEFDRGLLYVAGGPTGKAFLYASETGALVASSSASIRRPDSRPRSISAARCCRTETACSSRGGRSTSCRTG